MSVEKEETEVEVDEDFSSSDNEEPAPQPVEVTKTNLTTRRTIDNYLEERRLQKQIADYDFDV